MLDRGDSDIAACRSLGGSGVGPQTKALMPGQYRLRRRTPDVERRRLRSRVNELFTQSRGAAGSRSLVSVLREHGEQIARLKVRGRTRTCWSRRWTWLARSVAGLKGCGSIPTRARSTAVASVANGSGVTACARA